MGKYTIFQILLKYPMGKMFCKKVNYTTWIIITNCEYCRIINPNSEMWMLKTTTRPNEYVSMTREKWRYFLPKKIIIGHMCKTIKRPYKNKVSGKRPHMDAKGICRLWAWFLGPRGPDFFGAWPGGHWPPTIQPLNPSDTKKVPKCPLRPNSSFKEECWPS